MKPNEQQQAIINHFNGPCLVAAVPGSGKTASVTARTKKLIESGIDPSSILSITFTNKAAKEMKDRLVKAIGQTAHQVKISTFHSLCATILRSHSACVGLKDNYTIYDTDDSKKLLEECIQKIETKNKKSASIKGKEEVDDVEPEKYKPTDDYLNSLCRYLEGSRNSLLSKQEALTKYNLNGNQLKVVDLYFESLKKANAIDFTGLINEVINLFENNSSILSYYQNKWKYISVDEVQDTNVAQFKLMRQLSDLHKNILVCGDLSQSIYRFRDASPENILHFEKEFKPTVLKLENNYRSTPNILKYAQNLIQKNHLRMDTVLKTDNLSGQNPVLIVGKNDYEMAEKLVDNIKRKIVSGITPSEIAVLYRTNYASRVIESALRFQKINYKVIGGVNFMDRKEVKWAFSILRLLSNKNDRMAFQKSVEACCRGVGIKTLSRIDEIGSTPYENAVEFCKKNSKGSDNLKDFVDNLDYQIPPYQSLKNILYKTSLNDKLLKESTPDNDRVGNVLEVAGDLEEFINEGGTLSQYLQNMSLLSANDEDAEKNQVKLMSMHACKGLEFDVVYISHACENIIPHERVLGVKDPDEKLAQLEEERRLMYVGMTRAKKYLNICYFKEKQNRQFIPSRFIRESGLNPIPSASFQD